MDGFFDEKRAIDVFRTTEFRTAREGDEFFGALGPGNIIERIDRPFERFAAYEKLLLRLLQEHPVKYRRMHKGTPFGFMAWLAFDLRNYEKALLYMDTGIAEDVRKHQNDADPTAWVNNPGPRFLLLDPNPANPWFRRTFEEVELLLEKELTRFNRVSGTTLDIDGSWRTFARRLLLDRDPTQRTLLSALYIFLLKFTDRSKELSLREGCTGGSNQPFTVHLFTGGLLFESLLKRCYPTNDRGEINETLGGILKTTSFLNDFFAGNNPFGRGDSSAGSLEEVHRAISGSSTKETAFKTATKLRNTTGHNLVWDDIFDAPTKYVALYEQAMNAILHVISAKFV